LNDQAGCCHSERGCYPAPSYPARKLRTLCPRSQSRFGQRRRDLLRWAGPHRFVLNPVALNPVAPDFARRHRVVPSCVGLCRVGLCRGGLAHRGAAMSRSCRRSFAWRQYPLAAAVGRDWSSCRPYLQPLPLDCEATWCGDRMLPRSLQPPRWSPADFCRVVVRLRTPCDGWSCRERDFPVADRAESVA